MMATSSNEVPLSLLKCKVCKKFLHDPKCLPCGHTICGPSPDSKEISRNCLSQLIVADTDPSLLICPVPVCRKESSVDSVNPNLIVKDFLDQYITDEADNPECKKHKKPMEYHCGSCEKSICKDCWEQEHNGPKHKNIELLSNLYKEKFMAKAEELKLPAAKVEFERKKSIIEEFSVKCADMKDVCRDLLRLLEENVQICNDSLKVQEGNSKFDGLKFFNKLTTLKENKDAIEEFVKKIMADNPLSNLSQWNPPGTLVRRGTERSLVRGLSVTPDLPSYHHAISSQANDSSQPTYVPMQTEIDGAGSLIFCINGISKMEPKGTYVMSENCCLFNDQKFKCRLYITYSIEMKLSIGLEVYPDVVDYSNWSIDLNGYMFLLNLTHKFKKEKGQKFATYVLKSFKSTRGGKLDNFEWGSIIDQKDITNPKNAWLYEDALFVKLSVNKLEIDYSGTLYPNPSAPSETVEFN